MRAALRTTGHTTQRCPKCGDISPKVLADGERTTNWTAVLLLLLFTAGLGLLWTSLWRYYPLLAHCRKCHVNFDV